MVNGELWISKLDQHSTLFFQTSDQNEVNKISEFWLDYACHHFFILVGSIVLDDMDQEGKKFSKFFWVYDTWHPLQQKWT